MNFTDRVQEQFAEAGWIERRNILEKYDKDFIKKAPKFLKEFLKEFGDLDVSDAKSYKSNVTNRLEIKNRHVLLISEDKNELDYLFPIIGKEIYLFAFFHPDGYYIGCDSDGKIYMIGDYTFHIANSSEEGIEILIKDDWSKGYLQLDEDTGVWSPSESYSGWND